MRAVTASVPTDFTEVASEEDFEAVLQHKVSSKVTAIGGTANWNVKHHTAQNSLTITNPMSAPYAVAMATVAMHFFRCRSVPHRIADEGLCARNHPTGVPLPPLCQTHEPPIGILHTSIQSWSESPMQILPKELVPGILDFYNNYKKAVTGSGVPGANDQLVASVMGAIMDRRVNSWATLQ